MEQPWLIRNPEEIGNQVRLRRDLQTILAGFDRALLGREIARLMGAACALENPIKLETFRQQASDSFLDNAERHPFLQELRGAFARGPERSLFGVRDSRVEDNGAVAKPRLLPQLTRDGEAILPRHVDVHDDQIRLEHPQAVHGLERIGLAFDKKVAGRLQPPAQHFADDEFIVDAKDSGLKLAKHTKGKAGNAPARVGIVLKRCEGN